jgi:amino acid adenylation domain-containing protein
MATLTSAPSRGARMGGEHTSDLVAEQARRTPERPAVVDAARTLTYRELEERAAVIAAALRARGASAGARVGLLLERTGDAVAAVLGVWKAGSTYVPIDPATPLERVVYMLRDSRADLLVTDVEVEASPELPPSCRLSELLEGANGAPEPSDERRSARDLAYVMYTSGTTGRPKGVMIEHRSIVNLARAHRERIYRHHDPEGKGLRASLNAPFAFDGSVERILLLLHGCTIFVVGEADRRDPAAFLEFARRHDLDVLDVTPSFLSLLLRFGLLEQPGYRPKLVLVGGEAIGPALWKQLGASSVAFYNVYGPTETTINASVGRIAGDAPHLGLPLPNVRVYILDENGEQVVAGSPGEIHVAGAGVARGYLNLPELTAEKFTANPFAPNDPLYDRLYATGDRGRFLPDGTIEYLGRADGQIKLRGYRIEPEEVTTAIRAVHGVQDALVRLEGDEPADARLVAYVAAPAAPERLEEELRASLTSRLPTYMVPSRIAIVEAFPLTSNGKVDTETLAARGAARPEAPVVPPEENGHDVEARLAALWSELLALPDVPRDASFFEIGGHSLLAPVMLRRVADEFGVTLPLTTLFLAPTVSELAHRIEDSERPPG